MRSHHRWAGCLRFRYVACPDRRAGAREEPEPRPSDRDLWGYFVTVGVDGDPVLGAPEW
jgi:hypothetical protein